MAHIRDKAACNRPSYYGHVRATLKVGYRYPWTEHQRKNMEFEFYWITQIAMHRMSRDISAEQALLRSRRYRTLERRANAANHASQQDETSKNLL